MLHALNPAPFADLPLPDLAAVRGVIIQKALPGRRRASQALHLSRAQPMPYYVYRVGPFAC